MSSLKFDKSRRKPERSKPSVTANFTSQGGRTARSRARTKPKSSLHFSRGGKKLFALRS